MKPTTVTCPVCGSGDVHGIFVVTGLHFVAPRPSVCDGEAGVEGEPQLAWDSYVDIGVRCVGCGWKYWDSTGLAGGLDDSSCTRP
jgi:hypothetical protein